MRLFRKKKAEAPSPFILADPLSEMEDVKWAHRQYAMRESMNRQALMIAAAPKRAMTPQEIERMRQSQVNAVQGQGYTGGFGEILNPFGVGGQAGYGLTR